MPSWVTLVCGLLKALGLVDQAERFFISYQDRKQGKKDQRLADLEAECEELKRNAGIAANAPVTRSELEEKLNQGEF